MNQDIEAHISKLSDWHVEANELVATFSLDAYDVVRSVVTEIMALAEKSNHHPTVTFGYKRIVVKTVTHEAGNEITEKDISLAQAISTVVSEVVS